MNKKSIFLNAIIAFVLSVGLISCDPNEDDNNNDNHNPTASFVGISSPYLICANRNPGGVGFDFEYNGVKGGANNMDSLAMSDFDYDIKIKTIKGEKADGSLGGAPFFQMNGTSVQAVNYTAFDSSYVGITGFQNLNASTIKLEYVLQTDDQSFGVASLPTGGTGNPLMENLLIEFNKLVIGLSWKTAAFNTVAEDEPIWIIQTKEGKLVKMIVVDFPASPAPSPSGYIAIEWDFID